MKKIIVICVAIILVCTTMMSGFSISSSAKVQENPKNRVGLWWWNIEEALQITKRDSYLNFYETMGITEIYFYACGKLTGGESGQSVLHNFVLAANQHHMKVALLYDNMGICDETDGRSLTKLRDAYITYRNTYPDDELYGIHFDIEGFSSFEAYIANFIGNVSILRDAGIEVGVDVNCAWDHKELELDGVQGFYEILATHIDYLTLMSYRTTPENILSFGKTGFEICKKYHCDCLFGAEAGNTESGDNVDFSSKSIMYMMAQVRATLGMLDDQNLDIGYGIALHHAKAMYNLIGSLPGPYVTAEDYDPEETGKTHPTKCSTIYENHNTNLEIQVEDKQIVHITTEEMKKAFHEDYDRYGPLRGDLGEYYLIRLEVCSIKPNTVYPCLYDAEDDWLFWAGTTYDFDNDFENGPKLVGDTDLVETAKIHDMFDVKTNQYGRFVNDNDGIALYISGRSTTLQISGITIETCRVTDGKKVLLGDVNQDENLDMKDVLLMRRALANMETDATIWEYFDANADQKKDMKDVLYARFVLANMASPNYI